MIDQIISRGVECRLSPVYDGTPQIYFYDGKEQVGSVCGPTAVKKELSYLLERLEIESQ